MRTELFCAVLLVWCAGPVLAHSDASAFAAGAGQGPAGAAAASGEMAGEVVNEIRADSDLIRVAAVEARTVVESRAGIGRVIAPAAAVHDVNAFISGQVKEIYVRPGSHVRAGDPVALIESPEFVLVQKAFVALLGNEERLDILSGEGRLPNFMKDARENLRWWGLSDEDIEQLEKTGETLEGIVVDAAIDGVISEVLVQPGELLSAGDRTMAQFVVMGRAIARIIADDRPLWVEGLLFPDDLAGVRPGDVRVRLRLPDGKTAEYPVHDLSPALDDLRQLGRVFVKLEERDGLYPGQPLDIEVLLPRAEEAWAPRAALMGQGLDTVVFVQTEPGTYVRRMVEPGPAVGDWVPVAGLQPGTAVVTHGKMALEGAYRLMRAGIHADDHHH
ncbi:MAG: efflux RND transporter periplasmic adaptor subunit [Thiohalobacteraceae bacterium]